MKLIMILNYVYTNVIHIIILIHKTKLSVIITIQLIVLMHLDNNMIILILLHYNVT